MALLTASEAPAETIRSDRRVRGELNHHDRARAADGLRDGGAVQVGDPGRGDVVAIVDINEVEIRLGYKQQLALVLAAGRMFTASCVKVAGMLTVKTRPGDGWVAGGAG